MQKNYYKSNSLDKHTHQSLKGDPHPQTRGNEPSFKHILISQLANHHILWRTTPIWYSVITKLYFSPRTILYNAVICFQRSNWIVHLEFRRAASIIWIGITTKTILDLGQSAVFGKTVCCYCFLWAARIYISAVAILYL